MVKSAEKGVHYIEAAGRLDGIIAPVMANSFSGKRILLAVTGSIAAYKSCDLIRLLGEQGAQVQVMLSEAGERFVGRATFQALSGQPVFAGMFAAAAADGMDHIGAVRNADLMLIARLRPTRLQRLPTGWPTILSPRPRPRPTVRWRWRRR